MRQLTSVVYETPYMCVVVVVADTLCSLTLQQNRATIKNLQSSSWIALSNRCSRWLCVYKTSEFKTIFACNWHLQKRHDAFAHSRGR